MPKPAKTAAPASPWDSEVRLLAWLATCVSVFSFLFFYRNGDVLLYGDAIAHMNIARRVFDSKTPGLLQLGTVWLPLPHLLMIPFLLSTEMWQRGVGGSLPSMAAYMFGVIGIFRLVRGALSSTAQPDAPTRIAAWIAAIVYAANPNLIYMQTTAMGESLYLALFIWAVAYFGESVRGDAKALTKCALCVAAACLTRYDGWLLAAAMAAVVLVASFLRGNATLRSSALRSSEFRIPRTAAARFILIAAAAPLLWIAYNGIVYRNPLEFANGPYSARAIERKTQSPGYQGHPGSGDLLLAERYFLKSAEANLAGNEWLGRAWILLALAGAAAAALAGRHPLSKVSVNKVSVKQCFGKQGFGGSRRMALTLFARSPAFLCALRGLRRRAHFHSSLVAVHSLQCALRIAVAPGVCRCAGDLGGSHPPLGSVETSHASRRASRAGRVRRHQLRNHLAHRPDFSRRSARPTWARAINSKRNSPPGSKSCRLTPLC